MTVTTTAPTDSSTIPAIGHHEAMDLLAHELQTTVDLLRGLDAADWTARTDCPAWDVRQLYLHVLGACEAGASMRENAHQMLAARRLRKTDGGPLEAALSAVQVREREHLGPADLVARLEAVAPRTVRGRRRMPALLRRVPIPVDGPVVERWSLGYLIDLIYLRDAWMHRIDTTRATGREPVLTADHDGRIVADVVAEWARRHGQPFALELTGPAGGTFRSPAPEVGDGGTDTPSTITLDAVAFCRTLSGRVPGEGLLATVVPF